MKFKEWLKLQEIGTGTSAIAVFARPFLSDPVERIGPMPLAFRITTDDEHEHEHRPKKKKRKKKH